MSKWICTDCGDAEGSNFRCIINIPELNGATDPEALTSCPISGEECEWFEYIEKEEE